MLVYGGDADVARDLQIVGGSTVVQIRTVNLGAPVSTLKARFADLASEIARHA
jgi:hypothetical protein